MVAFNTLWQNHPTRTGNLVPCSTKDEIFFKNQCTIRMGVCLQNSGVNTAEIPNVKRCWYHKKIAGHILLAEELAMALKENRRLIPGMEELEEINPTDFKTTLKRKRGIIFLKDYYRRNLPGGRKERTRDRSGDHIDLWNGMQLTDPLSLARIQQHLVDENNSDMELSKAIWFWEVY
jgi:uncharacterized protein YihD (DUF1040 family)